MTSYSQHFNPKEARLVQPCQWGLSTSRDNNQVPSGFPFLSGSAEKRHSQDRSHRGNIWAPLLAPTWRDSEQHLPPFPTAPASVGATWLRMTVPKVLWEHWKCHHTSQLPEDIGLLIMSSNLNNEPLREGGWHKQSYLSGFSGRQQISKMAFKMGKTWNCQWWGGRERVSSCQSAEVWQDSLLKAPLPGQPAILGFIWALSTKGSLHGQAPYNGFGIQW